MRCEEFIALVAKYAPRYDRPSVLSIYNTYRKDTSIDVHEYIQQNLPHEGDIKVLSIIEAYGPSSYTELSSAVKWLHQNKYPVRKTLCGPTTSKDAAKELQAFLDKAIPVRSKFDHFCINLSSEPSHALYANFRQIYGNQLTTNKPHPFVTDRDFWMGSLAELNELFQRWYILYSAEFPSELEGHLSAGECAAFLGIKTARLLAWLQTHPNSCILHNYRFLIPISEANRIQQQWSSVCPVLKLLNPKLASVPQKSRQVVKTAVLNLIKERRPSWVLGENEFPQQSPNISYTNRPLLADHAVTEIIHTLPILPLGCLKELTGMSLSALREKAADGAIEANENWLISTNERNRVRAINHQYKIVDTIVQTCLSRYPSNFCLVKQADRTNLIDFGESNKWWGLQIVRCDDLPLDGKKLGYAVDCDDALQLENHLSLWLQGYRKTNPEKFALLVSRLEMRDSDVAKQLRKFEQQLHPADNALVDMVQLLYLVLPKELRKLTDCEIENILVTRFSTEGTLTACNALSDFLLFGEYTKRRFEFLGTGVKLDTSAYPVKDFAVMVWHVVNDEVIKQKDLIPKAVAQKKYADLWLYIALHVYSSWRSTDYIRMSAPLLPYSPEVTLEKIKNGLLLPAEATNIAEYFIASNRLVLNQPNKTMGTHGVPKLYFYCPQSCMESFGTILAIATAHYEIAAEDSFVNPVKDWLSIKQFFGDDFLEACGNRGFSGRRANKALLQSIEFIGREDHQLPPMVAYHLASIMRSHKLSYGKPSETTDIYLRDANFSGLTPEFVIYQMWERGVCSFVTDAMMKICYGDKYKSLPIAQQTQALNSMELTPSNITNLVQCIQAAEDRACEVAVSVCRSKSVMEDALKAIALGHGIGKDPDMFCIRKAIGMECAEKSRLNCIGCMYEIRTKALLLNYTTLHHQIYRFSQGISPVERERRKYLAETVTFPALVEIMSHIDAATSQLEYKLYKDIIEEEMTYGITDGCTA